MADQIVDNATQAGAGASAAPTIEEFMKERNTPAGASAPAQAETPESAPGEPPQTPDEPGPEPEGGGKAVRELIDQRRKRQEVEKENAYLKGVLDTLAKGGQRPQAAPQQPQPQGPQIPKRPVIEEFQRYEDFEAAREKWMDDMVELRANQVQQALVQRAGNDSVNSAFAARVHQAAATNPRVQEAISEVGNAITLPMAHFIRVSPQGPQVLLYLHDHMDDAVRMARGNPYLAIAELGQIAGRLAGSPVAPPQAPVHPSKAPPPVRPVVNNGASVETPLDKMDIGDFMKSRNKEQYGR